jgi:hypothetical protein
MIRGEVIRIFRTTTTFDDFNKIIALYKARLEARGYTQSFVQQIITFDVQARCQKIPFTKSLESRQYLVVPFTRQPVYKRISKLLRTTSIDPSKFVPNTTTALAYSSSPSIAKLLIRSALSPHQIAYLENTSVETPAP